MASPNREHFNQGADLATMSLFPCWHFFDPLASSMIALIHPSTPTLVNLTRKRDLTRMCLERERIKTVPPNKESNRNRLSLTKPGLRKYLTEYLTIYLCFASRWLPRPPRVTRNLDEAKQRWYEGCDWL